MLYVILLISFFVAILAFQMIYVPISQGIKQANARAEEAVSRDLDAMFVFIPVEHLGYIKLGCMSLIGISIYMLCYSVVDPTGGYVLAGVGAFAGYFVPELILRILRRRRKNQFAQQLVDGLVLLSNGLRAGFTLQQALEMLVEESKPPLSQEFALAMRQNRLGMDIDEALTKLVERTEDDDLGLVVTAIMITRQIGGNLAEIFDRIVTMIRERKLLEGKVTALTAQGKMQAMVVALIPYILGVVVAKINPELMNVMWTTIPGVLALFLVVVLDTVGYFWVLKLTRIEY